MKEIYTATLKSFLIVLLFLATAPLNAQVSNYTFAQSSAAFAGISGGTLLGSSTSDDQRFVDTSVPLGGTPVTGVGLSIGFNFTYNGIVFDRFAIDNNGWISLGQSSLTPAVDINSTTQSEPLSSSLTPTPTLLRNRIVALGNDLQAQGSSSLRTQTIGSSPNRVCVIQWVGYRRWGTTGENLNFQIRLYETTNVVQIHFANMTFSSFSSTGSAAPTIGLGGTNAADFNNRTTTTNWNATTAGSSNTEGCDVALGVTYPSTGRIFSWTPPAVCSGTPTGGTTTSDFNPVCPGQAFTLSVSGATQTGGITYQWISSNNGINFSPVSGATNATLTTSQSSASFKRCIITCSGSGLSDTSAVLQVTMKPSNLCYCTSGAFTPDETKIDSVRFLTVATGSISTTCEQYTNYTSQVATVQRTVPFNLRIKNGSCSGQAYQAYVGVYIDLNQNGALDDAGELVYSFGPFNSLNAIPDDSITIPNSTPLGLTGMRIVLAEGDAVLLPCDAYDYGETEDYTLNVTAGPSCTNPPAVGTITGSSAICSGETTTLNLVGQALGTDLQWQSSPNGSIWSDISGAINASYTTLPILDTIYYRVKVTCVSSAFTSAFEITLQPFYQCYCTYGLVGNCGIVAINKVEIVTTTLNNISGCNTTINGDAYTAFPASTATATLLRNFPYTFNVTCNDTAITSVWIDYNHSGTFDSIEWTQIDTYAVSGSALVNIPVTALQGQTGMRVRSRVFGVQNGPANACLDFATGECEDYIITIGGLPTCATPPVGGNASGPITGNTGGSYLYVVNSSVGDVQWQISSSSASGPFVNIVGANNDSLLYTFSNAGTFWLRAYLTSPGCNPDSSNAVQTTVTFLGGGDDVCDAVTLSFGVNGPFNTSPAGVQNGEPVPPVSGNCYLQKSWCDTTISNTLWFKFIAPASGKVSIQSPDFDTQLALWNASSCAAILTGGATLIAANDDYDSATVHGGVEFSSFLDSVSCLVPGRTYYVQLDPYTAPGASTTIILTDLGGTNTPLTVSLNSSTNITCFGYANGGINMNVTGGSGGYSYEWSDGELTEDIFGLNADVYTLTVVDARCNSTVTSNAITISEPATLTISDSVVNVKCFGASTGAIYITAIGGTPSYTYVWSNGSFNRNLIGVPAGLYTNTVTDNHGCTLVSPPISVVQPSAPLSISLDSVIDNICAGGTTGAIHITVTGGTGVYSYTWSNSATTQDITGLAANTYPVSVTDANNCIATPVSGVVKNGAVVSVVVDLITNNGCAGVSTGAVAISVSGGTPNYTYNWSTGANTQDISSLSAGIYNVTAQDALGCKGTGSATVVNSAGISVTVNSVTNTACAGLSTGAIDISVSGGTPTYTFVWSNGRATQDIGSLSAGIYSVSVEDAVGCTATLSATVANGAGVSVNTASVTFVTCLGGNTGTINISVGGGTPTYTFNWSNGKTTEDIDSLTAGSYTVSVEDAVGCSTTYSATVDDGAPVTVTIDSVHHVSCNGLSDGAIYITASGGAPNYSYLWCDFSTVEDPTGLSAGAICGGIVTDMNGCTATISTVTLLEPDSLVVAIDSFSNVKCFGSGTGCIYITPSGGTPSYSYLWNTVNTAEDVCDLFAGNSGVTVTDANSCSASISYTITQPLQITATSVATDQIQGGALGSISVTTTGGVSPYTYSWNDGTTTEDRSNLTAGGYAVTITDANGCTIAIADLVDFITGIGNAESMFAVNLYPNPTQEKMFLEMMLNERSDVVVDIYSITGQFVQQLVAKDILATRFEINFTNEASGVYYAKIKAGDATLTKRIVVAK